LSDKQSEKKGWEWMRVKAPSNGPISNYDPPERYFFITTSFLITEMHTSQSMQPKFLFLPFPTFTKEKYKLLTRFGLGLSLISLKWLIPF